MENIDSLHPEKEQQETDQTETIAARQSDDGRETSEVENKLEWHNVMDEINSQRIPSEDTDCTSSPVKVSFNKDSASTSLCAANDQSLSSCSYQGVKVPIASDGSMQMASAGSEGVQNLQTLVMANSNPGQAIILQYVQTADGQQILLPSNQVVLQGGDMQAYQICSSSSAQPQNVLSSQAKTADPQSKREIRLAKNREAARECRRKKKEYVKCLEKRVGALENKNKMLLEELRTLMNIYCTKTRMH